MRSHAKASTAGSTQRQAGRLGRISRGALGSGAPRARRLLVPVGLAAAVLTLMVLAIPASATKAHLFKEVFGSAAQPSFTTPQGMAIDQDNGDVYVMDAGSPPSIKRFNADGTPDPFSALASNAIDGQAGADATPQGGLGFSSASESQIAIDNSGGATDGNVYVTQGFPNAINVFSSTGAYLGQLTAAGATDFSEACGVAVDSTGAIYVGDYNAGIKKFVPAANPPVNADHTATFTTTTNPCTLAAGAGATAGFLFPAEYNGVVAKIDSATGELKYTVATGSNTTVTVDPGTGHVYAASGSSVEEFDASGAGSATAASSTSLSSGIEGIAARGSSGDVFVSRSGNAKVEVLAGAITIIPDVVTSPVTNNTGAHATLNGTVNPDGVELDECFFEWDFFIGSQFGNVVPCAETPAEIGVGTSPVAVHADISGLVPNGSSYSGSQVPDSGSYSFRLVAVNANATSRAAQSTFITPDTVFAQAASGITSTEATLNGTVNPDGEAISACVFEWGPPKEPGEAVQKFPEAAPCVPGPGAITGTAPVPVHADLSDLDVGAEYRYRLKVTYPGGTVFDPRVAFGQTQNDGESFQTAGPVIEGAWSEEVIRTEATLKAAIDPEGSATTYRFEWGESAAYGNEAEGNVGSDSNSHEVSLSLDDLKPDTTYHYRVTATSAVAENVGPDRTFTTYAPFAFDTSCANQAFRYGLSAPLPDCRAYEMVSPVDKNGGDIRTWVDGGDRLQQRIQASTDGNKLAYASQISFGDQPSTVAANQYIASRNPGGWSTHGINAPQGLSAFGAKGAAAAFQIVVNRTLAFSPDLSTTWLFDYNATPLAPGATGSKVNLYQRDNAIDAYEALGIGSTDQSVSAYVAGFSDDLSHVAAGSNSNVPGLPTGPYAYDYSNGEAHPVGILPDGTGPVNSAVGSPKSGGRDGNRTGSVSRDGSRIFWSGNGNALYVRENPAEEQSALVGEECTEPAKACTTLISPGNGLSTEFWAASADGSTVLYSTEGNLNSSTADLYLYDVDAQTTTQLTGNSAGVAGQSEDLSRVYFVSTEALAPGGVEGERNLYLYDQGAIGFIAALSVRDTSQAGTGVETSAVSAAPYRRTTRVTPDGEVAVFMSNRSLTGYDNADAVTGEPAYEVYRYEVGADELTCVSCNPSGSRPVAQLIPRVFGPEGGLGDPNSKDLGGAWIPSWEWASHASNVLSEDGDHVFFNALDTLVPGDTNGVQDVYQWEAQGSGTCTKPGGCIDLITTGQSKEKTKFLDASPDGRDVYFETKSSILPQDPGLIDIYDARAGGGYPPPPPPPPPCIGDACQNVPAPPNDPTPASAGFRGAGDPQPRKANRRCRARNRHAGKRAKRKAVKQKAKRCKRAKRRVVR